MSAPKQNGDAQRQRRRRLLIAGVVVLALLVIAVRLLQPGLEPLIAGKVWRSPQPDRVMLEQALGAHRVRAIINLRGENTGDGWYDLERAMASDYGAQLIDIKLSADEPPPVLRLRELVAALESAPQPYLLHCMRGVDRTGLAAALAMVLVADAPLDRALDELPPEHWPYKHDTIGRQFFAGYQSWLAQSGRVHSREQLRDYATAHYVDADGNLRFVIDSLNGRVVNRERQAEDGYHFSIAAGERLRLSGWAFGALTRAPLAGVEPVWNGQPLGAAAVVQRDDVAAHFDVPALAQAGWELERDTAGLTPDCGPVQLRLTRRDGSEFVSRPQVRLCIDPAPP